MVEGGVGQSEVGQVICDRLLYTGCAGNNRSTLKRYICCNFLALRRK